VVLLWVDAGSLRAVGQCSTVIELWYVLCSSAALRAMLQYNQVLVQHHLQYMPIQQAVPAVCLWL
jgi:hypothetical protein